MGPDTSSSRPAPPSPTLSSSSESTISLSGSQSNLPSSPEVSYAPHGQNHRNSLGEKDEEKGGGAQVPSSGPILPMYADTNGSDTTAVAAPTHTNTMRKLALRHTLTIRPAGESGRTGFHPLKFLRILMMGSSRVSKICNLLWPLVPVSIVLQSKSRARS